MKQAMIFAAGLGTRLKPLTDNMPKALVEVAGHPLLERVLFRLRDAGFDNIVINVHHFAGQIIDYLNTNSDFGMNIKISDETDKLLETGGGIKKARKLFSNDSPIMIHNVDILSNVDLDKFYSFGIKEEKTTNEQVGATLLVSERKTKRYLVFNENMHLVGWTNIETGEVKSPYREVKETISLLKGVTERRVGKYCLYAFSGIHSFSPKMFPLMDNYPDKFPIMDFYLENCDKIVIKGYVKDNLRLMDVGKQETLSEAESFLKTIE